jgi:putative endonuclease
VPRPPPELRRGRRLTNQASGAWGEDLALRYLLRRGYRLLARNYRKRRGEIDLIVTDDETLVFVEVKLRRSTGYGDPLEAVTSRKQATIRSLAEQYLAENQPEFETLRFDVIGILATRSGTRIVHIKEAF